MEKLIIVGIGDLAKDVSFFVNRYKLFQIVGYSVNKQYLTNEQFMDCPVYPLENLEAYVDKNEVKIFVAISWFNYLNRDRKNAFLYLKDKGFSFANLISPKADVLTDDIGEGNWICDYAYLDFSSKIGSNCILRNHTYLAHYASLGDHVAVIAKASIGGGAVVKNQSYIGMCAVVFNNVVVGEKCLVGGATIVKRSLPNYSRIKLSDSTMEITQFSESEIEYKLMPGNLVKK